MPKLPFRLESVDLALDGGGHLRLPLFYPEISALGRNPERLTEEIHRGAAWVVENESPSALYRRRPGETPQLREVQIELEAPGGDAGWARPVALTFHAFVWPHGASTLIAYVPLLDIEVLADDEEQLARLLPNHIRFALLRLKATGSLRPLVWLQRVKAAQVLTTALEVDVRTPRERAARKEDEKPTTLREVTSDLAKTARNPVFERESLVTRLAEALTGRRPRSVLLVGPSGVGKTALVAELTRRRAALGLAKTPLRATSGARLVSGMTGYGMWQERCQKLCRDAARQKAILHLGNLVELMEVGKYEGNQQGVASFLRPYLERGDLLAICECTPEQLSHIERQAPNLLDVFLQIAVAEPTAAQCQSILRQYAAHQAPGGLPPTDDALAAVDRLHRRYATYSANPGRPLRFLHNLLENGRTKRSLAAKKVNGDSTSPGEPRVALDAAAITAAFSAETGLPLDLLDESRPLDLRRAHAWFSERVLGQEEAVERIVDLLASVKANLTRPSRPIASLLFIGPTGVGKTEMAKALAEFLYRDARRMTRIDMSEYADPLAADRLIGGSFQEEGFLTAKIREQPFGVVLLDEFEKAHPRLFDMLLQVLGEGRLTDAAGRLADFSNSVVIMTSNLGADEHKKASLGFADSSQAADRVREVYLRAVRRFVRPELFNRIDRIVPFNPLQETLLRRIARRELNLVERRDGIRYRDLRLELTDDLAAYLSERGFHPRYGARPLKRAMERELLAPLADALNNFAHDTPLAAEIEVTDRRLRIRAAGRKDGRQADESAGLNDARVAAAARRCVELRREAFRLQQSHAVIDIDNTIFRLEAIEKRLLKNKYVPVQDQERLRNLPALRKLQDRVHRLADSAARLEERILLPCYGGQETDRAGQSSPHAPREENVSRSETTTLETLNDELTALIFDLYAQNFGDADLLTLVVYGENPESLFALADGYYRLARERAFTVAPFALRALTESIYQRLAAEDPQPLPAGEFFVGIGPNVDRKKLKSSDATVLRAAAIDEPVAFLAVPQEGVLGLALRISGPLAFPLLEPEYGAHQFRQDETKTACLVHTVGQDFGPKWDYFPPEHIDRRGQIGSHPLRRQIDFDRNEIDDRHLEGKIRLASKSLDATLLVLTQRRLVAQARKWLGL